ncbi:MAG: hypothetical protein M5U34_19295 [Chloroflexi bacterium]|nr:hypothetical protein [Chloroflexota bacterium]
METDDDTLLSWREDTAENGRCHPKSYLSLSGWKPTTVPCCLGERIWGKRPLSPQIISFPFGLETDRSTLLFCREDMGENGRCHPKS